MKTFLLLYQCLSKLWRLVSYLLSTNRSVFIETFLEWKLFSSEVLEIKKFPEKDENFTCKVCEVLRFCKKIMKGNNYFREFSMN